MGRVRAFFGALLIAVAAVTPVAWAGDVLIEPRALGHGFVEISGAVRKPGLILLKRSHLPVSDAVALAGGYAPEAYLFGAVLLRKSLERNTTAGRASPCLPDSERQALATIESALPFDRARELIESVLSRRLSRSPVRLEPLGPRGGVVSELALTDGDVLVIPPRPAHVHVAGAVKRQGSITYQPGWLAEDYRKVAQDSGRSLFGRDVIVLPGGESRTLDLGFWNYRPTAVPPGSLLIFDADERGACLATTAR